MTTEILPPTQEELRDAWNDASDLQSVHKELDDGWRHGNYVFEVFQRISDQTFWAINYQESGDGEYNSLRDDPIDPAVRVYPKQITTTTYVTKEPK